MATIPAPDIFHDAQEIAQAPQNAMAEYARVAALQQQTQQQAAMAPLQRQQAQQQIQAQQRQFADQDALTKAITQYDPSKNTLADVPKLITQNGGSGQAALQAQQGLLTQKQNLLKLSDDQFAQQQKLSDLAQGVHDEVTSAKPEEKQAVYTQGLQRLGAAGMDVSKEPAQYPGDDVFSQHLAPIQLHSAIVADAAKQREADQNAAKARNENAEAAHQEFLNKLTENSKPGDFDKQVDGLVPPTGAEGQAQNQFVKAQVNAALSRGDVDGAKKFIEQAYQNHLEIQKDVAVATNPAIQQGKINVATAEGQARANVEAAAARGTDPAVANVPPKQVLPAKADYQKANADYAQNQAVTARLNAMMDAAHTGNVIAYQIIPEEGTLQITTSQGVHRINMAEIEQYAGGGSLWQRMEGHFGKQLSGQSIPASVLDDMAKIQQIQQQGSRQKYENTIKGINQTYGAKFDPVDMGQNAPGGATPLGAHTATGPNGHKIIVKDGKWVDAQTGAPVQ